MEKEHLTSQTERKKISADKNVLGAYTEAKEFLRTYAGKDNQFVVWLKDTNRSASSDFIKSKIKSVLTSFQDYVNNYLLRSISLEREIQIKTVSDYLDQANTLLKYKKIHPAVPAIMGASLKEILRNLLEEEISDISSIKPSLGSLTQELKKLGKIGKQNIKDVISWSGTRNVATNGHWEEVNEPNRIRLMLAGVNLLMRRHSQLQIMQ